MFSHIHCNRWRKGCLLHGHICMTINLLMVLVLGLLLGKKEEPHYVSKRCIVFILKHVRKYPLETNTNEPQREKTNNVDSDMVWYNPGCTATGDGYRLEVLYLGRRGSVLYIQVAKTKALISFAVTAKLICVFVLAYAKCWFSHGAAQM